MEYIPAMRRDNQPRWRVALVGGAPSTRTSLRAAICRSGGSVAVDTGAPEQALRMIGRARADVSIVAPAPVWHGCSALFRLGEDAACPVVLLSRNPTIRLLEEARAAGVMACLVEPVRWLQLAATLDFAVARFQDAQALRQSLVDRKVIERAKGLLMAQQGLTENEAFTRLRRSAMDTQRPLAEIARALLLSTAAGCRPRPASIVTETS